MGDVIELLRWWEWFDVVLMLPLNQRWLLSLLLLAKDVDGILQFCESCPLSVNVTPNF
jgi:hypothetical protein